RPSRLGHQRVHESLRIERLEVLDALAEANQLHRDLELADDADDDPALRGPVELGQAHAGKTDRLVEHAGLRKPVLTGRGVEDHQGLVWSAWELALHDAPELRELVHQA